MRQSSLELSLILIHSSQKDRTELAALRTGFAHGRGDLFVWACRSHLLGHICDSGASRRDIDLKNQYAFELSCLLILLLGHFSLRSKRRIRPVSGLHKSR